MIQNQIIRQTYDQNVAVSKLIPFCPPVIFQPGPPARLHLDDYFALGTVRGGMKGGWFSSTIAANNGPLAPADEGMSYVSYGFSSDEKFPPKMVLSELQEALLARKMMENSAAGRWAPSFLTTPCRCSTICTSLSKTLLSAVWVSRRPTISRRSTITMRVPSGYLLWL